MPRTIYNIRVYNKLTGQKIIDNSLRQIILDYLRLLGVIHQSVYVGIEVNEKIIYSDQHHA